MLGTSLTNGAKINQGLPAYEDLVKIFLRFDRALLLEFFLKELYLETDVCIGDEVWWCCHV